MLCQIFDHLKNNPRKFLHDLLAFIQVEPNFEPSVLNTKINIARPAESALRFKVKQMLRPRLKRIGLLDFTYRFMDLLRTFKANHDTHLRMEKLTDLSDPFISELYNIYQPANQRLEDLLSIELHHWKKKPPK